VNEDIGDFLYETSANAIENDLEYDSLNDTAPSALMHEDEIDNNCALETNEDLKKMGLKDLIYKLFLNIYNSEKENIKKLIKEIFPRINENTELDNYITYAISNCMDHVKDELQSFIKKNLKSQRKKTEAQHKSMINDSTFVPYSTHVKEYNEVIDKIIDFYDLFKSSINQIVEVWKEKLGHIDRLYDIFEFRHKKLFGVNIWQDKEIIGVMKLYYNQNCDDESYIKRVEDLKIIDDELSENNQYNSKEGGGRKQNKKLSKEKKSKKSKKKSKDSMSNSKGENGEKLYEINDIDLLCSIIQNSNDIKTKTQNKKMKNKKNGKSTSPGESSSKLDKTNVQKPGKENNCLNKGKMKPEQETQHIETPQGSTASPSAKTKKVESVSKEQPQVEPESAHDESKEIEDLKNFLKMCCKTKRKMLIKPNIPIKWVNNLKAKLAKIQSK